MFPRALDLLLHLCFCFDGDGTNMKNPEIYPCGIFPPVVSRSSFSVIKEQYIQGQCFKKLSFKIAVLKNLITYPSVQRLIA
jgi:hypothetical protein